MSASTSAFKSCACGRSFTREEWLALPFVGVGFYDTDGDDGGPNDDTEAHESRNCPCGSTLSRMIATSGETLGECHGDILDFLRAEAHESRNCPCGSTLSRHGDILDFLRVDLLRALVSEHAGLFEALHASQVQNKHLRHKLSASREEIEHVGFEERALRVLPAELKGVFWDEVRKRLATEFFRVEIETSAKLRKLEKNAAYGKGDLVECDRVSRYPIEHQLREALVPLVRIADAYDANNLDDEARKRWGPNLEHENTTPPEQIELYLGRGGKQLLTLKDCLDAREIAGGNKQS